MSTFNDKLKISIGSGIMFALMSSPWILSLLGNTVINTTSNCLTDNGIIIQMLIFGVLTYLTMYNSKLDTLTKISHTTYGSLIFYFVANPATYRVLSSLFGSWISNINGCPTNQGILLHSIVYIFMLVTVMYFP
jgi:hypothetical protein